MNWIQDAEHIVAKYTLLGLQQLLCEKTTKVYQAWRICRTDLSSHKFAEEQGRSGSAQELWKDGTFLRSGKVQKYPGKSLMI